LTYTPFIRFYLWKKYKYRFNFEIFLYLIAALIIILISTLYTSQFDLIKLFYVIPILILIDIALYIGILYLFRILKKEDFKNILSILNIKNIIKVFREDLTLKNNNSERTNDTAN